MDDSDTYSGKIGTGNDTDLLQDPARTELLEVLFQLSVTLSNQESLDGDTSSTLLAYYRLQ